MSTSETASPSTTAEKKFETGKVFSLSAGHFVHDVYSAFLAPLLPLLIAKFDLTLFLAGLLTVCFRLPSLASPYLGTLADKVNLRPVALAAPTVTALAMTTLGVAPAYIVLCLLLLLGGISAAFLHVYGPVMIARSAGDKLGRGMSYWMTGGELARTVGPLAAVWTVSVFSLSGMWPVTVVGLATSAALWVVVDRWRPAQGRKRPRILDTWRRLGSVMPALTAIVFARSCLVGTMAAFLPTFVVSKGSSLFLGGASLSVLELAGTGGTFLGGSLSDRVGRRRILLMALPASCGLMLAFVHAPSFLTFPLLLLLGFAVFTISPVALAVVHDHAGEERGSANGLYMGINFVTSGLITLAIGWLGDVIGLEWAFTLSAVLALVGVPAAWRLKEAKE